MFSYAEHSRVVTDRWDALSETLIRGPRFYTKRMFSYAEPSGTAEEPREALSETKIRRRGTVRNRGRNREFFDEALSETYDRCHPAFF